MKTMTPAQAQQHLTHVADRFDHWRQTRTTPAEPIPHSLWEQAIAFTTTFSIARVATRLRVQWGGVETALYCPPRCPGCARVRHCPGLCGSDR